MTGFLSQYHISKSHVRLHDGQTMPVTVVGRGEPVVLIHGFGMESTMWLPSVLPLVHRCQFFLPQLRGFGAASQNTFSHDDFITDYIADIVAMRAQLGLDTIRLGGISMGALTNLALHAAGNFDGVTHLMHIDQSPVMHNTADWPWGVMGIEQPQFFDLLARLNKESQPYLQHDFADLPLSVKHTLMTAISTMIGASFETRFMQQAAKWMPKYPNVAAKLRQTAGWQNQLHIVRAYLTHAYDFRPTLPALDIPVMVVSGQSSKLYDVVGQRAFADLLPNATHVELEHTGHATLFDSPIGSYRTMRAFVEMP